MNFIPCASVRFRSLSISISRIQYIDDVVPTITKDGSQRTTRLTPSPHATLMMSSRRLLRVLFNNTTSRQSSGFSTSFQEDHGFHSLKINNPVTLPDLTGADMPTSDATRTTIQLTAINLEPTTTTNPKTKVGSNSAEIRKNVTEFASGSLLGTLKESPVSTTDGQRNISYLGFDQNMPFYLVHAGVDFYDGSKNKTHTQRPERVPKTVATKEFSIRPPTSRHVSYRMHLGDVNDYHVDTDSELRGQDERFEGSSYTCILNLYS